MQKNKNIFSYHHLDGTIKRTLLRSFEVTGCEEWARAARCPPAATFGIIDSPVNAATMPSNLIALPCSFTTFNFSAPTRRVAN